MFALKDEHGDWVRSRLTGARMVYSERRLARMAQTHIAKHRKIVVKVVKG